MFGIEWTEYAVIAIVALIVIGPKELPAVLRAIGQWTTKIRRMAAEFQGQFQEALREAEMADLKKEIDDATKSFNSQFEDPLNFKEATKWEPNPDPAKLDDMKSDATPDEAPSTQAPQESASVATGSPPDTPPQGAEGKSAYPPLNASHGTAGEESFPIVADHSAIEPTLTAPSPADTGGSRGGNGGGAAEASAAPLITPPLAQPPLPEGSGQERSEGGVHS